MKVSVSGLYTIALLNLNAWNHTRVSASSWFPWNCWASCGGCPCSTDHALSLFSPSNPPAVRKLWPGLSAWMYISHKLPKLITVTSFRLHLRQLSMSFQAKPDGHGLSNDIGVWSVHSLCWLVLFVLASRRRRSMSFAEGPWRPEWSHRRCTWSARVNIGINQRDNKKKM